MQKVYEVDILAEQRKKLRITLSNGDVIVGRSHGLVTAVDDEGEELDYDVIYFESENPTMHYTLKSEDIEKVEIA